MPHRSTITGKPPLEELRRIAEAEVRENDLVPEDLAVVTSKVPDPLDYGQHVTPEVACDHARQTLRRCGIKEHRRGEIGDREFDAVLHHFDGPPTPEVLLNQLVLVAALPTCALAA